jgi:hypothetical protein
MEEHECKADYDYCTCYMLALEPDEKCPIHSNWREYPERCDICGRYIKTKMEGE